MDNRNLDGVSGRLAAHRLRSLVLRGARVPFLARSTVERLATELGAALR